MKPKKEKPNTDLAAEVTQDFESRKNARRAFELQWQLNADFLRGLQNNYITKFDTVVPAGRQFYWQAREVFNHIKPMVEQRLGKLASYIPVIGATNPALIEIVQFAFVKAGMFNLMQRAQLWAEITGTCFYKIFWGKQTDDIEIAVCSPFEIYPDQLTAESIEECQSIIHAKVYNVRDIERIWGTVVPGQDIDVFDTASATVRKPRHGVMENAAVVIERWERPSHSHPNGRLVVIAGGKVLMNGELPFVNHLPFVRQCASTNAGCFYGTSVIEGAIPIQRAYNAVKNRKTEFLNRLACGVLSVEDGSMDLESLENDGLAPGKVLVYRQGTQPPKFVDTGNMPAELAQEEERLLRELEIISGVASLYHFTQSPNTSGVALQTMVEQENRRMSRAVGEIIRAVGEVANQILRLSNQFKATPKGEVTVTSRCDASPRACHCEEDAKATRSDNACHCEEPKATRQSLHGNKPLTSGRDCFVTGVPRNDERKEN